MNRSIWDYILAEIAESVNKQDFETWFSGSKLSSSSKERIIIEFPEQRIRDFVESSFMDTIVTATEKVYGYRLKIDLISSDSTANSTTAPHSQKDFQIGNQGQIVLPKPRLNPSFEFSRFIVGGNNEQAYAAAKHVSSNPGHQFNPVFIWGGVGLGKTHLLQAICHKLIQEKNYFKVLYIHSDQFIEEIVTAIRNNQTSQFKLKYRFVDILLIDDIQFIKGEVTQVEFFHTFNALYESGKQIVISSDRPPKNLTYLTDRIRNRFEWGLITSITTPNADTRFRILQAKANEYSIDIEDEVLHYVAKRINTNIRALEGALSNLRFANKKITKDIASDLLSDFLCDQNNEQLSIDEINDSVSKHFAISQQEIISKSRSGRLIIPRFLAIYLASKYTKHTTKEIGRFFGGRDHSTIINARKEIEIRLNKDQQIKKHLIEIESSLSA